MILSFKQLGLLCCGMALYVASCKKEAAAEHAKDMYVNNYFSHISPQGTSPIQRAIQAGYTGMYVGENIAKGYTTIPDVMLAWKNSEAHCKAMMDTLYKEFGASTYNGYWVQEFGR